MDLCPDYFNSFEPINKPFDKNDIFTPMHCVSFPAGTLFLRKKRKFDIENENENVNEILENNEDEIQQHQNKKKKVMNNNLNAQTFLKIPLDFKGYFKIYQ